MGKYTRLKGKLPRFENEPSWQQKIDARKGELKLLEMTRAGLALMHLTLKNEKEQHEAEIKKLNVDLESLSQVLVMRMEDDDLTKFELEDGSVVAIRDEVYVGIKDKAALIEWVHSTGQQDLLTVNAQTIAAITRENLIKGEQIPPGVSTFIKVSARSEKKESD